MALGHSRANHKCPYSSRRDRSNRQSTQDRLHGAKSGATPTGGWTFIKACLLPMYGILQVITVRAVVSHKMRRFCHMRFFSLHKIFTIAGTFLSLQHVTAKATVSFVRNSKRLLDGWTSMASSRLILDSGGRTWVIQDETNALKAEGRYDYCQELSLPSRTPP